MLGFDFTGDRITMLSSSLRDGVSVNDSSISLCESMLWSVFAVCLMQKRPMWLSGACLSAAMRRRLPLIPVNGTLVFVLNRGSIVISIDFLCSLECATSDFFGDGVASGSNCLMSSFLMGGRARCCLLGVESMFSDL